MKEKQIDAWGKTKDTFWGNVKCFFGFHYWYTDCQKDENGAYVTTRQSWFCRRPECMGYKKTYR